MGSHRMLAQLRDVLQQEQAERVKASGMLEHEQQRTQLLLDVLKHFKEKLQGLTPQMLLSLLGCYDQKGLPTSAMATVVAGTNDAAHVAPTANGDAGVRAAACVAGSGFVSVPP